MVENSMKYLTLNVIPSEKTIISDHLCYILRSDIADKTYIGYTVDFSRRIRQHNGEIVGGAKKTRRWRPWKPICVIEGFYENSSALRFEYRLQHPIVKRKKGENVMISILRNLVQIIQDGDGSVAKGNKMPWPHLHITWYDTIYSLLIPGVSNYHVKY
jgi:predicted GIY-YIG superfamily endonuclease